MNYKYIEIPGTEHKRIGGEAITDNKLNVIKAGMSISIMKVDFILRNFLKSIYKKYYVAKHKKLHTRNIRL